MNVKFLIKALIIGVVALTLSSYFLAKNKGVQTFEKTRLVPDFDASSVNFIAMKSAGDKEVVSAQKVSDQWILPDKFGYAADIKELSRLLQNIKNASILELKTKQKKYFSRLGLQDISDQGVTKKDSKAILLTLSSEEKSIELLLGNESTSTRGRYIRFADQLQTYLVDLDIDIPKLNIEWLKPNIVPLDFSQIRQVEISLPDEQFSIIRKPLALTDTGVLDKDIVDKSLTDNLLTQLQNKESMSLKDNFELAEKVVGKTLQYDSIFTGLVRNIVNLSVIDVQLFEQHNMLVYQTIKLNYVDKATAQNLQTQQLILTLFKSDDDNPMYWLQVNNDKWLLQISEFDFKQVSKSLDDYLQ